MSADDAHETSEASAIASINPTERIVYLSGEVNEQSIAQITAGIVALASHDKLAPITLMISTYGGSVDEMFSLYDVIKYVPCPIYTIGLGKVMSAGVLLLASGQKGHRMVGQTTRLMIHPISGGMAGDIFQIRNEHDELERQQQLMDKMLMRETGMSRRTLDKMLKASHNCYLTAEEAVRHGIADAIFGTKENDNGR